MADSQQEGNWKQDSPELEEVDNHMLVVNTQQKADMADRTATSVEQEALPLLAEAQICHHACPFQSCAVSAK